MSGSIVVNITPPAPIELLYTQGGAVGPQGPQGSVGATGPVNKLVIGTVVSGVDATATLSGQTVANGTATQTLNLVLPQGATGIQGIQGVVGPAGPANVLSVGSVETTSATTASISITGTAPSQVISFVVPRGPQGLQGDAGPFTTVQVGGVTTGASGTNAKIDTVTAGGTVTLNFTIPRGADATANLADETPQPLGIARAGSSLGASRADHVHSVPVISYSSLTGIPVSFSPAAHTHSVSDVANLQAVLDSKQASGSYATLDGSGKVPSSMLPGFVDDVIEAANYSALPSVGEGGKLYVAIDTRKLWRWSGSTYVEIASSPGSTDSVTEGSTNLYYTDARASAAAPVQSVNGKVGNVVIEAGGIAWSTVPTATTTTTKAGAISYDSSYIYVANDVNQWRRTAIEDWTTPTISISVQPSNQTAVSGSATFSVTASATQNAELLYQWQRQAGGAGEWSNIATGLSATLPLLDLSYAANNGDKYRVVITSGAAGTGGTAVNGWLPAVVVELTPTATLTSGEATLTISASISIVSQPQNVSLTNGTSASFSVSATTPGTGLSYQWQSSPDGTNWTAVAGATSNSYALSEITETGYGGYRYRCIVSSSGYSDATSNAATLAVAPIAVTTQPASQTGQPVAGTTPNYSASFTSAASSPAGAPTIQWEVSTDGGTNYSDLSGQTSSSLALTGLTNSDSGKRYRAKFVKSGWNTVRSSAATLTVPTDTITVSQQPSNQTASVSSFSSTASTLPSGTWKDVSYANGKWFATPNDADGGDYIATSDDGVNWTKRIAALPYAGTWSKVLYGNGTYLTFLTVDTVSGTWCATSSDGLAWTARQISAEENLAQHSHYFFSGGGGWFFAKNNAIGASSTWVQSQDGISWTTISQSDASGYSNLTYDVNFTENSDGSQIMAWQQVSATASVASVTSSGVSQFTSVGQPLGALNAYRVTGILHNGSSFIAVGQAGNNLNSISTSGISGIYSGSGTTWTKGAFSASLWSVAYRNSRYVAASRIGIASSNDGLNWVLRQSGTGNYLDYAMAVPGGFIASLQGQLYTSQDGLAWTSRVAGTYLPLLAGDKVFVSGNSSSRQSGQLATPGGVLSASFASSATTTFGSPAIQWQQSTNGGGTWTNIAGAVSSPLSFTPTSADNGKRYRAVFTKGSYTTVNSNSATLTVP
jgi:hypothetical protein